MNFWNLVEDDLSKEIGEKFTIDDHHASSGGCINEAWIITGQGRTFFIKTNRPERLEMFIAEAEGLTAMAETKTIRVPKPLCWGSGEDRSYLLMEAIEFGGKSNPAIFGEQLAMMHHCYGEQFGWHRGNTIGSTSQVNGWQEDWINFWRYQRLGYQLTLARQRGVSSRLFDLGEELKGSFQAFFDGYAPKPSPLHGDLWSGNWGFDRTGNPVIFDPAFYFGDHEADLAMMELFGNPGVHFFAAYHDVFPIDPDYRVRKDLYNLYHILNHFNLFGGGYADQAQQMIEGLLAQL